MHFLKGKLIWVLLAFLSCYSSAAQVVLNGPAIDVDEAGICSVLRVDSVVEFQRGATCNPAFSVTFCKDDPLCTNIVFQSSDEFFNYRFSEPGLYYIFCDLVPTGGQGLSPILCYEVPPLVPTLGEWAVIILCLLILIIGVVSVSNRYQRRYFPHQVR